MFFFWFWIDGFVEKNKDRLPDTMVICMRSSLNVDMATWFANDDVEDVERRMSGGNSKDTKSQAKTRMRATVASKGKRKAHSRKHIVPIGCIWTTYEHKTEPNKTKQST